MSFSDLLERKVLDHIFGGDILNQPQTLYLGLSTSPVQDDGTGYTEPMGGGYARVAIHNTIYDPQADTGFWLAAETAVEGDHLGKGVKASAIDLEFPEAEGDWGTISHFFLTDGFDVLGAGKLNKSRTIEEGDVVRFKAGELMITLD